MIKRSCENIINGCVDCWICVDMILFVLILMSKNKYVEVILLDRYLLCYVIFGYKVFFYSVIVLLDKIYIFSFVRFCF